MNQKQKKFIRKKLIPFILRQEGAGFGMTFWLFLNSTGTRVTMDGVTRTVPACGTVACIGGSIQVLTQKDFDKQGYEAFEFPPLSSAQIADVLGISTKRAHGLCFLWLEEESKNFRHRWPVRYSRRFAAAGTPREKAEVAADLLRLVVKTNGRCLGPYKIRKQE